MKYIIMILIVIGLAAVDFVTGIIKATVLEKVSSKTMRTGGLKKAAEILIMTAFCGLEVGLEQLCIYYGSGEDGARTYNLLANSSILLLDETQPLIS
jgi:phage-related holin